jgi:hypothetical protein
MVYCKISVSPGTMEIISRTGLLSPVYPGLMCSATGVVHKGRKITNLGWCQGSSEANPGAFKDQVRLDRATWAGDLADRVSGWLACPVSPG